MRGRCWVPAPHVLLLLYRRIFVGMDLLIFLPCAELLVRQVHILCEHLLRLLLVYQRTAFRWPALPANPALLQRWKLKLSWTLAHAWLLECADVQQFQQMNAYVCQEDREYRFRQPLGQEELLSNLFHKANDFVRQIGIMPAAKAYDLHVFHMWALCGNDS